MEHAISIDGLAERDPIIGWIGVFFIPFLIVCAILAFIGMIFYLIERSKKSKPSES
ncbi:MAG: hypothetical protein ACFFB8_16740 [Promethearchaeota archaeon]